jgi:hypothetical protein
MTNPNVDRAAPPKPKKKAATHAKKKGATKKS